MRNALLAGWVALNLGLPASAAQPAKGQHLNIATSGTALAYDKSSLHVHAGQPVTLTFKNAAEVGTDLKHNWVLVKPDTQDQVASEGLEAGEKNNYVPSDPNVLASTPLVAPGKSATIQFTAPKTPGKYPYLCTYPGHSQLLKGTLEVD